MAKTILLLHSDLAFQDELHQIFSNLGATTLKAKSAFAAMASLRRQDINLLIAESRGDPQSLAGIIALARQAEHPVDVWVLAQDEGEELDELGEGVKVIVGDCQPKDVVHVIGTQAPMSTQLEKPPLFEGRMEGVAAPLFMRVFLEKQNGRLTVQTPLGTTQLYARKGYFVWASFPESDDMVRRSIQEHLGRVLDLPGVPDANLLTAGLASSQLTLAECQKVMGNLLRQTLNDLISLPSLAYRFDGANYPDTMAIIQFNPFAMILSAEREAFVADPAHEATALASHILMFSDAFLQQSEGLDSFANDVDLKTLHGMRHSDAVAGLGMGAEPGFHILNALVSAGVLELQS